MKSTYEEAAEVETITDYVYEMKDDLLDMYKNNPIDCSRLLRELESINTELVKLSKDYDRLIKISG
jgi:hypothetical protein